MSVLLVKCILPVITFCSLLVAYILYSEVTDFQLQSRIRQFDKSACPERTPFFNETLVDCSGVFNLNFDSICNALYYKQSEPTISAFDNCSHLTSQFCMKSTKNEERFPLAFIITIHDDFEQFINLLKLVYHPDNHYCINVDLKADKLVKMISSVATCFSNVYLPDHFEHIYWGGYGQLKSQLNCLSVLSNSSFQWNYLINLAGSDFPLKSRLKIRSYLQGLNGLSHAEIELEVRTKRFRFEHQKIYDVNGVPYDHKITSVLKSPPPLNLTVYKGNVAALLSRNFTDWIQMSSVAQNFSKWLEDTDKPDEHYWASLLVLREKLESRPQFTPGLDAKRHKLAGSYMARWAVWRGNHFCGGKFVRDVCIFGLLDLPSLISRPELFANKFHPDYQPAAKLCLQQWLEERTAQC